MKSIFWFLAGALVVGCAPITPGDLSSPQPEDYAFDAVKHIDSAITDDADANQFRQPTYSLNAASRLLLRRQDLLSHVPNVRLDGDNKVQVQLTAVSDPTTAAAAIQICPLTRQFMMLATWGAAYPFGSTGLWQSPGGDFDPTDCAKGTVSDTTEGTILYDMTHWFFDYPKARSANFGLIVLSTQAVQIAGDTSGSEYPRLLWSE